jgi:hypothetical protein
MTWLSFFKESWSDITSDLKWLRPVRSNWKTCHLLNKKLIWTIEEHNITDINKKSAQETQAKAADEKQQMRR